MEHGGEARSFEKVASEGRSQALFAARQGSHERFCLRSFRGPRLAASIGLREPGGDFSFAVWTDSVGNEPK